MRVLTLSWSLSLVTGSLVIITVSSDVMTQQCPGCRPHTDCWPLPPGLLSPVWDLLGPAQSTVSGFVTSDVPRETGAGAGASVCCCPGSWVCLRCNIWPLHSHHTSHTLCILWPLWPGGRSPRVTNVSMLITSHPPWHEETGDRPQLAYICAQFPFPLILTAVCFCYGILWISCRPNSIAMIQYNANVIITNWWVFYPP